MHDGVKSDARRQIPAVASVLDPLDRCDLPRPVVVDLIRRELSKIRGESQIPEFESIVERVGRSLEELRASRLQPVINGTGVVIHTNFARAPLPNEAIRTLNEIGSGYSNLEYDLRTGERGRRGAYLENSLAALCGAETATVVNNCAAALVLIVHHFINKSGRARPPDAPAKNEVVISRGELVQIGGGFRIGEILEASGATLREVGATNRTTLSDYAGAIRPETAMILKVHRSNFFMSGFVESPATTEIAGLARKKRIPLVEDLGSGAILPTEQFRITEHEPTPSEALTAGVDLVCFSGDKLFGGPQAGIIAGKKRLIAALKREPLLRALRCDKLCFAALQATVDLHLNQATAEIPALALLQISEDELRTRAEALCDQLFESCSGLQITIGRSKAKAGGGALPKSTMTSVTLEIVPQNCSPADFAARLRRAVPPLIGYVANDRFKLDLRTIFPQQDDLVVRTIRAECMK
ncbi:MAG: L-seryl-tRNA(Sec) selenium transferase [Verrucomicrobia bacterium]|nr:MAG: L-seryl-tRNA(Sec) selenium transferase [Verrucomicrobiota bacterium]PYK65320.1 MAG: L-seryl-tRNA(Sec) selenium transferase [Verrucomicrobiota bacterium]